LGDYFFDNLQNLKQHIGFKIATLTLVFVLLVPTAIKFIHIFNHHKHEICNGEYQTHLHTSDLDCSFQKFKLTTAFTIPELSFELINPKHYYEVTISQYLSLSDFQPLHFLLRGPPQLI
jgi:hypothetical protein